MVEIVLPVITLGTRVSEKGRVQVQFNLKETYSLAVKGIKALYGWGGKLFVVYETENAEFYRKWAAPALPEHAVKIPFNLEEGDVWVCTDCGSRVEWDADEPVCPNCGADCGVDRVRRTYLRVNISPDDEVDQWVAKVYGAGLQRVEKLHGTGGGGFRPLFDLPESRAELYKVTISRHGVVKNPTFEETYYDFDGWSRKREFRGRYLVVDYTVASDYGWYYAVYKLPEEAEEAAEEERPGCPICGQPGYLEARSTPSNTYYYYVHVSKEGGRRKVRKCYLGPSEYKYVSIFNPFGLKGAVDPERFAKYARALVRELSPDQLQVLHKIVEEKLKENGGEAAQRGEPCRTCRAPGCDEAQ